MTFRPEFLAAAQIKAEKRKSPNPLRERGLGLSFWGVPDASGKNIVAAELLLPGTKRPFSLRGRIGVTVAEKTATKKEARQVPGPLAA